MAITVKIDKNLVLVYCLLNTYNLEGGQEKTPIQLNIKEHFKLYEGPPPSLEEYGHEWKLVLWALSVGRAPSFSQKTSLNENDQRDFNRGNTIKSSAMAFYKNSDFRNYYKDYLKPQLQERILDIRLILKNYDVISMLEASWGIKIHHKIVVIPNPFTDGSFGIELENTNYNVIGNVSNKFYMNILLHEASHPIAKKILKPYKTQIAKLSKLLEIAQRHPEYCRAYRSWEVCFEEHFIRALHINSLGPKIFDYYDINKALEHEKNYNGMIFIDTFYKFLQKHNPTAALPLILESLQ